MNRMLIAFPYISWLKSKMWTSSERSVSPNVGLYPRLAAPPYLLSVASAFQFEDAPHYHNPKHAGLVAGRLMPPFGMHVSLHNLDSDCDVFVTIVD